MRNAIPLASRRTLRGTSKPSRVLSHYQNA
jgi:hypothetical protein